MTGVLSFPSAQTKPISTPALMERKSTSSRTQKARPVYSESLEENEEEEERSTGKVMALASVL